MKVHDGPAATAVSGGDMKVTVERELVSQAEEEDMEALLDTYVLFSTATKILAKEINSFFLFLAKEINLVGQIYIGWGVAANRNS